MIKIALCDDDRNALPVIAGAVESACRAQGIGAELQRFSGGRALLEAMEVTSFQLVLLDIDMPDMDGIAVGKCIREKRAETEIIYVSECESRVFESFAVRPLGFVRKSNFLNDITDVLKLYAKNCLQNQDGTYIQFATRTNLLSLKREQIRYIEGSRNYQLLYLIDRSAPLEVKMTMEKLETLTVPHGFIRIHKGYLVNARYIQRIHANQVTLDDGVVLPIGRSKMGEVKYQYLALLGS
ncbi:MAG: LytR/AlgR family response regulator transcription factor [Candidatus Onthomonas sp.]